MRLTRRRFAAAGVALGSGCLSGGSNVRYPAGEGGADGRPVVGADPATAAAREEADAAPPNPTLGRRVRRIHDEVRWFGTRYEPTLRAYRQVVEKAVSTVERVRSQGDLNENTVDVVERAVDRVVSLIEERVEPHFGIAGYVRDSAGRHVGVTRTFAARGDIDRAQEELLRLGSFLSSLTSTGYVNRNLSDEPVRNRLLPFLRVDSADGDDGDDGDDPDDGELFEVWDVGSGFRAHVYDGPRRLREEREPTGPFDGADRSRYRTRFAPAVAPSASNVVYLLARRLPAPGDQPAPLDPERYDPNAVCLQAFPDVAAASAARRALVEDGPVSVEDRARLGGWAFDRAFYRAVGDVQYAFLVQAAEFLVVVAAGETAWNERIDWTDGLERSWLWSPVAEADAD